VFKKFVGYLLVVASLVWGLGLLLSPLYLAALGAGMTNAMNPGSEAFTSEFVGVIYLIAFMSPQYWVMLIGTALVCRIGKWLV